METVEKYIKEKIKDERAISMIKSMLEKEGLVNLDFEDVKSILDKAKETRFFSGTENDIAKISYPEADGALVSIEGPETMSLDETRNIVDKISDKINEEARIVWGARINKKLEGIKFFAILAKR